MSVDDLGREAAHLGQEAAQLLSLANIGESGSLSKLAELAVRQVPGCSAAHATMWREGELVAVAATHPDPAELADLELAALHDNGVAGPLTEAALAGVPVYCPDTLTEERWPAWTAQALSRGVRSCVHLARQIPPMTLVLALFGVRPGVLDADSVPVAEMLAGFGRAALAGTMAYGEAQRTATQLRDSVAARAITDQAKGILMHALGCTADEALRFMRRESQQRHVKVTDVAARVIATYGGKDPGARQRRLPAIPAPALAGAGSEPHEPNHEDDDRHPPQRVQREAQPAKQEGEQENEQDQTHDGLQLPGCRSLPDPLGLPRPMRINVVRRWVIPARDSSIVLGRLPLPALAAACHGPGLGGDCVQGK